MHTVTCDSCGKDLSTTDNAVDWRLLLANEKIPCHHEFVTDITVPPAISGGNVHLCGIECLKKWVNELDV